MVAGPLPPPAPADELAAELGNVRRLNLRPGDRCVLNVDREVSREIAAQLEAVWEGFAPGVKLLILPPDWTLTVLGKDEEECASSA